MTMDVSAIASVLTAQQAASTQMALLATMARMNADMQNSIVHVLEAAQTNLDRLANVGTGVGEALDITA